MNLNIWFCGFITAIVLFQLVSIPALILKKNDLADVLWGPAFPICAFASLCFSGQWVEKQTDLRSMLILNFVTIWAIRLFLHVGVRNLKHKTEDVRYGNWRKKWGKTQVWRSYLQVFVLQAFILFLFLIPVLLSFSSESVTMGFFAWMGVVIWVGGFILETVADEQLRRFKLNSENRGKMMTTGVWSWSRHPNYFGEVTQWWGIWLMVCELPYGWLSIIGPIGVNFLILKVSGVSMLEDLMKKSGRVCRILI